MRNKPRRWDSGDDDPLAGLVNLFDVWMVFSIALLIAMIGAARSQTSAASGPKPDPATAASPTLEQLIDTQRKLPSYRVSEDKLSGQGQRLGTAYRLQSGEVVYVPD
ncbi:DUF2149 domain-containing protein [Planctomyces sp. SH-PL14]|jgi:hypothetical protein|uniref:DUF2149 domain-containing protein n=1 Tax=Planctomyces sp. SH-PL14 TaxID=1632864 RepID=UPI00078E5B24|nr:DUF2149 domain-containing protein [Planctomyces sp. SH-PL14]AMV18343.1 hypothetical protein VT03_10665 [Planctomyces sp. SH-PL14]